MILKDIQLFQIMLFLSSFLCLCGGIFGSAMCQEPPPVPNAYRKWSRIGMNAELNYTCYTNYKLMSGDLVRNCVNGIYSGEEPVCKLDCGVPRNLEGATVSYSSSISDLESVSNAMYDCLQGLRAKGNNKITCNLHKHRWWNSKFNCFNHTKNIAKGCKAFQADGINVDHVVDGDTVCKPLNDTTINIYLNATYKIIKIFITHNIARINKISVSAIQKRTSLEKTCLEMDYGNGTIEITKTLLSSKFYASTKCFGDIVRITFTLASTLSICDIEIYGNLFIGDCGQPPVEFGQTVEYANTTEGSTALLSCVPPLYPASGHGIITCRSTAWTLSKLICTGKPNIAVEVTNDLYGVVLDKNFTTCVNIVSPNGDPSVWSLDLGQDYEVYRLLVTFGEMDLSQQVKAEIVLSSGRATSCQYKWSQGDGVVVAFVCQYARITRLVKLYGGNELHLCDVKVEGRYYDEPLECYNTYKGRDYKGLQNVTRNGRVCIPWATIPDYDSNIGSFPGESYDEVGNHCRNPSNDFRVSPWCFISQTEWHYCPVPECDKICLRPPNGMSYNGNMAKSASDKICKEWNVLQNNKRFYYELPSDNHCGNHVLDQSKPWCIVEDGVNLVYEHCNIPECPKFSNMTFMTLSQQSMTDTQFLANVSQCYYHTGINELYFHSNYSSVFDSACSETNTRTIIFVCSLRSEEWKIIEYICDPISVSSESLEPTSAYEDKSTLMESVTDILSELSTTAFIDPTTTYDSKISFTSVSDVVSTYSDVITIGSFSDINTDYLSVIESYGTSFTTSPTVGLSRYVVETVTSTQLVSRSCQCYCRSKPSPNLTDLGTKFHNLHTMENLILNKSNLSRTFRKKNSIHDSRTFAIALGSVGVCIIIGSALFLASNDFSRVFMGTSDLINRARATTYN